MSQAEVEPARIVRWGHPALRRPCRTVAPGEPDLRSLADAMWRLMLRHNGLGLAAPQVGDDRRLIVVRDGGRAAGGRPLVLVNPVVGEPSRDRAFFEEGCLSFPGLYFTLGRPRAVTVAFDDLDGRPRQLRADGLLARVVQHEVDHLDGVLYIDHLSPWRRALLTWRLHRLRER